MKKFCESLRKHEMVITNFEKKRKTPLANKQYKSYLNQKKAITFAKKV